MRVLFRPAALVVAAFAALMVLVAPAYAAVSFSTDVLMYHEVNKAGLKQEIIGRLRGGQQLLSLETLVRVLNGEQQIPDGVHTFIVTFDDGLASQYEQALPALEEIKAETPNHIFVPAIFFVMTKFENAMIPIDQLPNETWSYNDKVHRYMSKGQLVDLLKRGYWVDNHTVDHANLPGLTLLDRSAQVEEGRIRINELWHLAGRQKPYQLFAYPNGSFQGQVGYLEHLGYDVAFTTQPTSEHSSSSRLTIGRLSRS